ncbi:MAG TPA: histidine phosphatase family protein [Nitrososphaeraceae archaeon]
MKTLLILRHAKAVPKDPNSSDHDRSLDSLGKDDALRMGEMIKDKDMVPCFIISSTALRAKTTAELVAKGCKYEADIVLDHCLYEAKPKDYLDILETVSDRYSSVLITGHNPTIEETIQMLTNSSDLVAMPSCGLAHLSIPVEKWSDIRSSIKSKTELHGVVLREILQPR